MDWHREFEGLGRKVGFAPCAVLPEAIDAQRPPGTFRVYESAYAGILTWECTEALSDINERWRTVQAWFDSLLLEREQDRRGTFDGYMLVILPSQPLANEVAIVSAIEADIAVCRKHFMWPGKNGARSIAELACELTPIGLPDAASTVEVARPPELTSEQRSLVECIAPAKSPQKKALEALREMGWAVEGADHEVE